MLYSVFSGKKKFVDIVLDLIFTLSHTQYTENGRDYFDKQAGASVLYKRDPKKYMLF
jgi:hypothetical protein